MRDWSEEQLKAIKTTDRSLLVSAAAGSGKTATLTQRCIELTCESQLCDITNLLVVTYTEAAAAEMKARIGKELRELEARLSNSRTDPAGSFSPLLFDMGNETRQPSAGAPASQQPAVARVQKQLMLLPGAQISTLHSFCARLIRRNFQLVPLDPDFRVLDEHEAILLKQEVISELFEEQFRQPLSDRFTRLIDLYADGSDSRIEQSVIHTHDVLRSLLDADCWRKEAIALLKEVDAKPQFLQTRVGRRFRQMTLDRINDLKSHARQVISALGQIGKAGPFIQVAETVSDRLDALEKHVQAGEWQAAKAVLDEGFLRRSPAPNCADPTTANELLARLKRPLQKNGAIYGCFSCDLAALRSAIIRTIPSAEVFLDLVGLFAQRFEAAKRSGHSVDFADLEHIALQLLRDPTVAASCREHFAQIMVDEFQDVNQVQSEILRLLSRTDATGRPVNLFRVGDVKQSIYRFRMADPFIFLASEKDAGPLNQLIPMQHNFRSRKELLDTINFVFRELMQNEAAAEIVYTRSHHLQARREFPVAANTFAGVPVELHLIMEGGVDLEGDEEIMSSPSQSPPSEEVDLDRLERESRYVARWIDELMAQNRQVLDKAGHYRPLAYGDIVILLRSARFSAIEYSRALSERGIPCFAESRTGFFSAVETNDLICILQLLDNLQQDIPFAAVLRCPVFALPEPETSLATIRAAYPQVPFHQAVTSYAAGQSDALAGFLKTILDRINLWRHRALMLPVADLLWEILTDTCYLPFAGALPNGRQRVANVLYLHRCARKFSSFQQQGLYRFIKFLEERQEVSDLGQPSPGEAGNAVQVMTIHSAKGLEFPVVIVSEIGKKFNLIDAAGNILVDRKDHLALSVADEPRFIRYPSAASLIVKESIVTAAKAEELRILYVAMTRAQEQLLLVGSTTPKQLDYLRRQSSPGVDPQVFRAADSYLRWLIPLAAMDETQQHLKIVTVNADSIIKFKPETRTGDISAPAPDIEMDLTRTMGFTYAHALAATTAAANSVTGLSKGSEVPVVAELDQPADAAPRTGDGMGLARGLAIHRFMEHLDLSAPLEGLAGQLQTMVAAGQLRPEDAQFIDLDDVRWLLNDSPVGPSLKQHAAGVYREIPMLDSVDAPEIQSDDPYDRVMVRGRIDAVLDTPEGLFIIDYKSDRTCPAPGSEREKSYIEQMRHYRATLQRCGFGKVAGVHLVFLSCRRILTITDDAEERFFHSKIKDQKPKIP